MSTARNASAHRRARKRSRRAGILSARRARRTTFLRAATRVRGLFQPASRRAGTGGRYLRPSGFLTSALSRARRRLLPLNERKRPAPASPRSDSSIERIDLEPDRDGSDGTARAFRESANPFRRESNQSIDTVRVSLHIVFGCTPSNGAPRTRRPRGDFQFRADPVSPLFRSGVMLSGRALRRL
jgi:hypothetical protein